MFYKNDDYTVWAESGDDGERYYIKYHGQVVSDEAEIDYEVFMLYYKEFNKPMERQRNERRRHIEREDIDRLSASGKLPFSVSNEDMMADLIS